MRLLTDSSCAMCETVDTHRLDDEHPWAPIVVGVVSCAGLLCADAGADSFVALALRSSAIFLSASCISFSLSQLCVKPSLDSWVRGKEPGSKPKTSAGEGCCAGEGWWGNGASGCLFLASKSACQVAVVLACVDGSAPFITALPFKTCFHSVPAVGAEEGRQVLGLGGNSTNSLLITFGKRGDCGGVSRWVFGVGGCEFA